MDVKLSEETISVLHEVRPSPSFEELTSSLAPAVSELENTFANLRAKEDSQRAELDATLSEVSATRVKLDRYRAATQDILRASTFAQG